MRERGSFLAPPLQTHTRYPTSWEERVCLANKRDSEREGKALVCV